MNNLRTVTITYNPSAEEIDNSKEMKAGKFLWPGFTHVYEVFAKQLAGGKFRYRTGLVPEEAPEDKREEIEKVVKELEEYYGEGQLDPFNASFWKDIKIKLDRKNIVLDVTNNPEHKLFYYIIKGRGVNEIAPSYDDAISGAEPKRWFLIEPEEYADLNAKEDRSLNKALAKLEELDEDKTQTDMFLVHKVLITSDRGTTKNTPKSALYKDLSNFIHGKIVKSDKRKTPKQFLETYNLIAEDKKKLYVTAYVKDSVYFNFIITNNEDNSLVNGETRTKYGTSLEKAIAFLMNPANQDELENIEERVNQKWSE